MDVSRDTGKRRRKDDPKPLTVAERQRSLVERRNAAGFVRHAEWVHREDLEALKLYARCLRARRFEQQEGTA